MEASYQKTHLLKITQDDRVGSTHISVYTALYLTWRSKECTNPFSIKRREIMSLCKIKSNATYHKVMKDLVKWNHIQYCPSFDPINGSEVFLKNVKVDKINKSNPPIKTNFYIMPANVVTPEDLRTFKHELLEELTKIIGHRNNNVPAQKWLRSHQVRKMLVISPGTLQNLRVNGTLPFTKIGGVIFYDYEDIKRMLEKHRHNSKDLVR